MDKKDFIKFLYDRGTLKRDENVYHAEKVFIINQVIKNCISSDPSEEAIVRYLMLVDRFINNKLDLFFMNDKLYIREPSDEVLDDDEYVMGSS
tara:strand:- start:10 stop:288 length:279 start_codon:yes stop_codon:yes gene_type:complete